eukprot:Skav234842  [mRNA]  locus=scaffold1355:13357:14799:+ [translate_table: standard]
MLGVVTGLGDAIRWASKGSVTEITFLVLSVVYAIGDSHLAAYLGSFRLLLLLRVADPKSVLQVFATIWQRSLAACNSCGMAKMEGNVRQRSESMGMLLTRLDGSIDNFEAAFDRFSDETEDVATLKQLDGDAPW